MSQYTSLVFNKQNSLQLKEGNTCLTPSVIIHIQMNNEMSETNEMKGTKETNNDSHVKEDHLQIMKKGTIITIVMLQVSENQLLKVVRKGHIQHIQEKNNTYF